MRRTVVYEVMRTNLILIMVKTVKDDEGGAPEVVTGLQDTHN